MKYEVAEINVVRATDGTFIIRTIGPDGVGEITTAPSFDGLTARLNELLTANPSIASQQASPIQVQ